MDGMATNRETPRQGGKSARSGAEPSANMQARTQMRVTPKSYWRKRERREAAEGERREDGEPGSGLFIIKKEVLL